MLLLIDCRDSFTWNIVHYFREIGSQIRVIDVEAFAPETLGTEAYSGIVLSPGPGHPREYQSLIAFVQQQAASERCLPILGICLGHQVIAHALGGNVKHAPQPVHGKTSEISHRPEGLFQGFAATSVVCRYHSLVVDEATLPPDLRVTAASAQGEVMALAHRQLPIYGVQFHPEAILTQHGHQLLTNFLKLAHAWIPLQR